MTAKREIKIQLNEDADPFMIKFSDEVDLEDLQLILQEAIENIAVKNQTHYDAWDARNSHLVDLKKVSGGETIVLSEKRKSPSKSVILEEEEIHRNDRNISNK